MYIKYELGIYDVLALKYGADVPDYMCKYFKPEIEYTIVKTLHKDFIVVETLCGPYCDIQLKLTQRQINKYFELVRVG